MMRIVFLGNNRVAVEILSWLKNQDVEIVGLVIHPPERQKYASELIATANLSSTYIFDGSSLRQESVCKKIQKLNPDMGLSVLFGYILKPPFLSLFPQGVINLHPSYLPYNRGANPNIWSILEGTPAGVTLHYIDAKVDTGDIIAQQKVPVEPVDTGKSLYSKLEHACVELFKKIWPSIERGEITSRSQVGRGTDHKVKDVEAYRLIDLDRSYKASDLINILRAFTFDPYPGAYFEQAGRRIQIKVELEYLDTEHS